MYSLVGHGQSWLSKSPHLMQSKTEHHDLDMDQ